MAPLGLLLTITPASIKYLVPAVASVSALVGALGALNQTQLRGLIAYSSINHIG